MTDLASIQPEPIDRKILFPEGHPCAGRYAGITVTVMQMESEETKTARRRVQDARLKKDAKNKVMTAEELEDHGLNLLYACMTNWKWEKSEDEKGKPAEQATWQGEIPEFNLRNVKAVLIGAPWIRRQIDEYVEEAESFFTS